MRVERVRDADATPTSTPSSGSKPSRSPTLAARNARVGAANSDVTQVYVLRNDEGKTLAFCVCWVIFDELHINTLAVAPAARRTGLATFLLREVMAEAVRAGARKATLEVRASNTSALGLYSGLGFHVAARRPRYYTHPEEDALILWRESLDTSP